MSLPSLGASAICTAILTDRRRRYPDATMFETLTDRFDGIFSRLRSRGKLTEADVDDVLREIRLALLEADVNLDVAKNLVGRIRERSVGEELSNALNPAQQVIKIVLEELTASLGGEAMKITYASKPPTVVLMAGLQGAGKTTNTGKLAQWFKKQGRNPLLVGADLQRPAAVEQLRTLRARSACRFSLNRPIPSTSPRRRSRRPNAPAATSSSSTPPAVWRSTRR